MSTSAHCLSIKRRRIRSPSRESQSSSKGSCPYSQVLLGHPGDRQYSPIHILNDDVLLNIFYVYLLDIGGEGDEDVRFVHRWYHQRWWYKLAQVCQRWRQLILASPCRLDIHLLCTYGVPVADMLAHSPPLPLTVIYDDRNCKMTAKDDEGALLALRHCDRLHRVSLWMPAPGLCKFITAMEEKFSILECMYIGTQCEHSTRLAFPNTFRAPNLRHVSTAYLPIASPLLANTMGLVNLELIDIPEPASFPPSYILTLLSHMPQLETLVIRFHSPVPNRDVTMQLLNTPFTAEVTLPHLRVFSFRGVSAYLEGLLARINAPALNFLDVQFFHQLTFTAPHLSQFIQASNNPRCGTVEFTFNEDSVDFKLLADPHQSLWQRPLRLRIMCRHLDWQVASVMQILGTISPALATVEKLRLNYVSHHRSSKLHDEIDRTRWCEFFRPFSSVKTLCVPAADFGGLLPSLHHEAPLMLSEFLPNLLEVRYPDGSCFRASPVSPIKRLAPMPSTWLCPEYAKTYVRWQELIRHLLLEAYLLCWIWQGRGTEDIWKYTDTQERGPFNLGREQCTIYKRGLRATLDWILNRGQPVEEVKRYAAAVLAVEERARDLGNVEEWNEWSDTWTRENLKTAESWGNEQYSSSATAATTLF